jgi:putative DNA primase/helicase
MTACLPFDYNPLAACPTWLKFLTEAMGARQELIELLQAWTKYVLTPKDKNRKAEIEKALILIGRKGTGKGTFLDVLIQLIGEENIGSASPDSFNDDKSMAQLLDKRVAMDTDASGFLASPGNFNKVVSNEPVPIKRLYQNPIATRLGCSVVLAMNKFPDTTAGSEGLDRRLCVVPFDHAPAVIGPQLSQKLKLSYRASLPGPGACHRMR